MAYVKFVPSLRTVSMLSLLGALSGCLQEPEADYTVPADGGRDAGRDAGGDAGSDAGRRDAGQDARVDR